MKCLLISGKKGAGKTPLIRKLIENFLADEKKLEIEDNIKNKKLEKIDKAYWNAEIKNNNKYEDYFCNFKIASNNVIISTISDTPEFIENFKKYCDEIKEKEKDKNTNFFIISPIRDIKDKEDLNEIFKKIFKNFGINFDDDFIEVPLTKCNRNSKIKQWHETAIFNYMKEILEIFIIKKEK